MEWVAMPSCRGSSLPRDQTHISYVFCVGRRVLYHYFCCCSFAQSCVRLFATPWPRACRASLSFTISWSLLKHMFIESVMPSSHLILCHPLLLLPLIFPFYVFPLIKTPRTEGFLKVFIYLALEA